MAEETDLPTILIVDDEPFNVDYLEQELEDLGYATVSAANGEEALERVADSAPDVILLDIMMPVMDGFTVLAHLKESDDWRHIPVIVISANDDLDSVVRGIEMGAEDYLPKPFEPTLLEARLSSSLEKKRLRDTEQLYLKYLTHELDIGRKIQSSFLPEELPVLPGWEVAAYFEAARETAGDFYDVFPMPRHGRVGLLLGDVSDKGLGAALFMTLFRSLIRAICLSAPLDDTADLLEHTISFTNQYVANTHGATSMFATVFLGALDLDSGHLLYVNAGHEPPMITSTDGDQQMLNPTGPMVGVITGAAYNVESVPLRPGDCLVVYSDGVSEAHSEERELYEKDRLLDLLAGQAGAGAAESIDAIMAAVRAFRGEAAQNDDITMLAASWH